MLTNIDSGGTVQKQIVAEHFFLSAEWQHNHIQTIMNSMENRQSYGNKHLRNFETLELKLKLTPFEKQQNTMDYNPLKCV